MMVLQGHQHQGRVQKRWKSPLVPDHQDIAKARPRLSAPPDNPTATPVDLLMPKAAILQLRWRERIAPEVSCILLSSDGTTSQVQATVLLRISRLYGARLCVICCREVEGPDPFDPQ